MNELGSTNNATALPKHVKLRESCDSCLIAKVKCSKARPVCARCLSNGAACGYSPSSRAGRKNRNASASKPMRVSTRHDDNSELAESVPPSPSPYLPLMHSMLDQHDHPFLNSNKSAFHPSTPTLSQEDLNRRPSFMGNGFPTPQDEGLEAADLFPTPPFDFGEALLQFSPQPYFQDFDPTTPPSRTGAPQSLASPAWTVNENPYSIPSSDQPSLDLMGFGTHSSSSHSTASPDVPSQDSAQPDQPDMGNRYTCDCFALCLQALQTLHNHSHLPAASQQGGLPFDVVLTINREAMVGCAAMLNCAKCVSKSGNSISTMLLATIFGKIISLYGAACYFRFGSSTSSQTAVKLAFGAYTLTGEDRRLLEMEIILLELRKVESILTSYQERFRNAQAEKDETSVYNALTSYLDKNLRYIVNFLQVRKGGICK